MDGMSKGMLISILTPGGMCKLRTFNATLEHKGRVLKKWASFMVVTSRLLRQGCQGGNVS
jgi:hypothetical protein